MNSKYQPAHRLIPVACVTAGEDGLSHDLPIKQYLTRYASQKKLTGVCHVTAPDIRGQLAKWAQATGRRPITADVSVRLAKVDPSSSSTSLPVIHWPLTPSCRVSDLIQHVQTHLGIARVASVIHHGSVLPPSARLVGDCGVRPSHALLIRCQPASHARWLGSQGQIFESMASTSGKSRIIWRERNQLTPVLPGNEFANYEDVGHDELGRQLIYQPRSGVFVRLDRQQMDVWRGVGWSTVARGSWADETGRPLFHPPVEAVAVSQPVAGVRIAHDEDDQDLYGI
jgi:hypothetical protein